MRMNLVLLTVALWVVPALAQEGPFTVVDAVHAARQSHPTARQADAVLEEARGERRASLSLESPAFAIEYEGVPEGAGVDAYEERRLSLAQGFDFPLRYIWHSRRQNALVDAAGNRRQTLLLDLERDVRTAFIDAWFATERQEAIEQYTASLDTQAQSFRRMHEVGRIADLDLSRAEAEAAETRSQLRSAQAVREAARVRLRNLAGLDKLPSELVNPLAADWVPPDTNQTIANNPILGTARDLADAAGEAHTLAATSWLPRIEASGFRQRVPGAQDGSDFWGVEIGVSVPLWYWLGGVGEIEAASARKRTATAEVQQRQIELGSEWRAAVEKLAAGRERVETFETILIPTSESVQQLARRSYEAGRASYLDVLEAQRTLLQRRIEHLESIRDLALTQTTLDLLAGRSILSLNDEEMEQ